jgi:hypothetical protein
VYAEEGEIGTLVGVVVNPCNRLVSHIVINARLDLGRREVRGQFVIPAAAIKMTTVGGTTLTDSMRDVNARPRFREGDFPMPPADWQLPFPYHAGEVHWPAHSDRTQPMIQTDAEITMAPGAVATVLSGDRPPQGLPERGRQMLLDILGAKYRVRVLGEPRSSKNDEPLLVGREPA